MRQLNLTPQVIVGHSAGAAIAAHMTLHFDSAARSTLIGLNPAWLPLPGVATPTEAFAAERMNRGIRKALAGRNVSDV